MRAIDEIKRLQAKIDSGDMSPDELLFVLRSEDELAADIVCQWAWTARRHHVPDEKIVEAVQIAQQMACWPVKKIPGRPETRRTVGE